MFTNTGKAITSHSNDVLKGYSLNTNGDFCD